MILNFQTKYLFVIYLILNFIRKMFHKYFYIVILFIIINLIIMLYMLILSYLNFLFEVNCILSLQILHFIILLYLV
jgi:hypothetical protein